MWALRKLRLWFIWRRPVTWSLRHSVAGTQRRKQTALKHETYLTRKTQPGTNWRVFWQSTTLLSSSSKAPGKATGSVSDRTHVRSLARRKSKWTIGGCGALRRCGCTRTYEGTQFLCVKFRLGSAGEPTICSHCYDVLNEEQVARSPEATYKSCGRPKGPCWSIGRPRISATKQFIWYQVINISKCHCFNWGLVTPHGDMTLLTMWQLMASCLLAPSHCK